MAHVPEREVKLTIPMLQNMELAASKTAEAVAEVMDLGEDKTAEVSMALIEACINSFEHSKSPDRQVYITFFLKDDRLEIVLRDLGTGFDPNEVEEPSLDRKLSHGARKRGWGLKLMENMMDSVNIESGKNGTSITMIKYKNKTAEKSLSVEVEE